VINTSNLFQLPFLFGGDPTVVTYGVSLLFEGIVSAVIVTYTLMLFWKGVILQIKLTVNRN
jgi:hypothetical protein